MTTEGASADRRPPIWASGPTRGFWLWYATLGGIALWMAHIVSMAALVELACRRPAAIWVMHALTVGLAVATLAAGWMSLTLVRGRPGDREDAPDLDGRLRFMGLFGLLTEVISFVLIVWEGAYVPFVDACR